MSADDKDALREQFLAANLRFAAVRRSLLALVNQRGVPTLIGTLSY